MSDIKAYMQRIVAKFSYANEFVATRKLGFFSFLFSFACMFMFIQVTVSRNNIIRTMQNDFAKAISDLNEIGLDVAYDNLEFDSIFIFPLLKIENLRLYNLKGTSLWNLSVNNIYARPRFFRSRGVRFVSDGGAVFSIDGNDYNIKSEGAELMLAYEKDMQFSDAELYLNRVDIKDWAKIDDIVWVARKVKEKKSVLNLRTPNVESHLEIKNVNLNGLLDYPLTSHIRKIYAQFNLIGDLFGTEPFMITAEKWLHEGGFIDVPTITVSWDPLLLVGKGYVRFNEKFEPIVQIKTSSKAIINLLNDLKNNKFLDKKGVFVANILLAAKGFKMKDDDEYLTISTPIAYRDNKLTVENITVKTVAPKTEQ